jgi:hypothetical protein
VTYFVTVQTLYQFALFLDGTILPESIYGAGTNVGIQVSGTPGQVVFSATAGQVLTLENVSSSSDSLLAGLATKVGGTQNSINVSIRIIRVA